jgi:hypothetical protein
MDISKFVIGLPATGMKLAMAPALIAQDRIIKLITLPSFINDLADGLYAAGSEAKAAGDKLIGEAGNPGVRGTLTDSANSIAGIVESLDKGVRLLSDATDSVAKVPRMGSTASRLKEAGKPIFDSTTHLSELSASMNELADTLSSVGESLERLGDHLHHIGLHTRSLVAMPNELP